jgi:DNA mismatch repair protein MutS
MKKANKAHKPNIHEEYLQYHNKYKEKYGSKALVLMQVGSFHEAYSTNDDGPNLFQLSELLNIVCTRKDKSVDIIDIKNPYMLGFPSVALSKFMKILIDNHYTIVIIDQTTPPPNPLREVTGIYSQSTFIDNISTDTKYLMVLYIEINQSITNNKSNISIGMCAVDSSTGCVYVYEKHGTNLVNEIEAIEETQRFYHYYRPVELVIYLIDNINNMNNLNNMNNIDNIDKNNNKKKADIINKLDLLPNQIVYTYNKINPNFCKLNYQNILLKKVYDTGLISPIEFFDLVKFPYIIIALTSTFDHIHQQNEKLIKELKKPQFFTDNQHKYMLLANNAQYQLNIIDYWHWDMNGESKFQSLYSVINNCCTSMGKRILKNRLCTPFTDIDLITNYYNLTEKILNSEKLDIIRTHLKSVNDLDKLFRKLSIKFIQPYELYTLYESFVSTASIINVFNKDTLLKEELLKYIDKKNIKLFIEATNYLENTFLIEKLKINNLIEIKESLYQLDIHKDIDEIQTKINMNIGFIDKLAKTLDNYDNNTTLHIKHNDRDGYYLTTTKIRGKKLQEILSEAKSIKMDDGAIINYNDLKFEFQTTTTKISYPSLNKYSDQIEDLYQQLDILIKQTFYNDTNTWYNKYQKTFTLIINFITEFDYICNNAFTSIKYHYIKPTLKSLNDNNSNNNSDNFNNDKSYIKGTNLRHPIIERIIDYEYTPHDINLNNDLCGNLIYGFNSSGKCFAPDTLLMLYNKSVIKAKNIQEGDLLMGDDLTPRQVLGCTTGYGKMYEITPINYPEDKFIVNGPHILCLKNYHNDDILEISIDDYIKKYNICSSIGDALDTNNDNQFYNNKKWNFKYYLYKADLHDKNNFKYSFFNINKLGLGEYCGFETNGNKRFLLYSGIVTHNSSLMKAVGLNLIMAQCGLYVPADSFEYNVFHSLYTRISGNDNLFKGHSSFIIEMNELRSILKRADSRSLIIGDEICRGTEYLSANSIFAAVILKLAEVKSKFLFASHLHELTKIEKIKKLDCIKFFHLLVEKKGDELIFNRKLMEGTGEQVYGIIVAKYILDDPEFIRITNDIKNELLENANINTKLVNDKKSNYNNEIYMDCCKICGSENNLESHHINYQKDFNNTINGIINNKKKHLLKDSKANLIVLCDKCHDRIHNNNIEIIKKTNSTKGVTTIIA